MLTFVHLLLCWRSFFFDSVDARSSPSVLTLVLLRLCWRSFFFFRVEARSSSSVLTLVLLRLCLRVYSQPVRDSTRLFATRVDPILSKHLKHLKGSAGRLYKYSDGTHFPQTPLWQTTARQWTLDPVLFRIEKAQWRLVWLTFSTSQTLIIHARGQWSNVWYYFKGRLTEYDFCAIIGGWFSGTKSPWEKR